MEKHKMQSACIGVIVVTEKRKLLENNHWFKREISGLKMKNNMDKKSNITQEKSFATLKMQGVEIQNWITWNKSQWIY